MLGTSRGATVAHLVGQRDNRISMVIAASGHVNFNRPEFQGPFFECSFWENKSPDESRTKILASSPLYFAHRSVRTRIHHGINDASVRIWHAEEMYNHLIREGKEVTYTKYDAGHGLATVPEFQQNVQKEIAEFLSQYTLTGSS